MQILEVPPALRRGALKEDQQAHVRSGRALIDLMCRRLGVPDLGGLNVLDMGCGTKLVQALLAGDLSIGRYTGIDVYREMIDFLAREVRDPRFAFHHMDTHNAMYNPAGVPLHPDAVLPVAEHSFDLVCLFSVFTHLEPHDYVAMLKLLRRCVKPGGALIYSLFVHESTPGGHGLIDRLKHAMENDPDALPVSADLPREVPDFHDAGPGVLKWAVYSRRHALALVDGTGWRVEALYDPEEYIQHYMLCRPC